MEGDGGWEGEGRLRFFLTVRRRGFDFRAFILLASFVTTELLAAARVHPSCRPDLVPACQPGEEE